MKKMKEFKKLIRKNYDKILVAVIAAIIGGLIVFVILRLIADQMTLRGGLNPDVNVLNPGCNPNDSECRAFRGWYTNQTKLRINNNGVYEVLPVNIGDLLYTSHTTIEGDEVAYLGETDQGLQWRESESILKNEKSFIDSETAATFSIGDSFTGYTIDWITSSNQSRVDVDVDVIGTTTIIRFLGTEAGNNNQPRAGQMMRTIVCNKSASTSLDRITWQTPSNFNYFLRWINGRPLEALDPNKCVPIIFLASDGPNGLEVFGFYGDSAYSI